MPKTAEQLQEDHRKEAQRLRNEAELAERLAQESRIPAPKSIAYTTDDDDVVKAYREEYGPEYKEPYKAPYSEEVNGITCHVLAFPSLNDAKVFFGQLADKEMVFLATEYGKGHAGHNFFSCGNGQLFEGSLQAIHDELVRISLEKKSDTVIKNGLSMLENLAPELVQNRLSNDLHTSRKEDGKPEISSGINPSIKR